MVKSTSAPLTLTQARTLVTKFRTEDRVSAARVRALFPHVEKSAAVIVDEVYLAYAADGALVPYAFGESTVQTALNVAKAWANLPATRAKISDADTTTILAALVQIRRTRAKLPVVAGIPAGTAVKRELIAKKSHLVGADRALSAVMAALAKQGDPSKWLSIVVGAQVVLTKADNLMASGVRASSVSKPASDDDAALDVNRKHNDTAGDARTGDEKAEKRNAKNTRKSKHERDPLESAKPGNSPENLPGASTGEKGNAPAERDPLAEATMENLIAAIAKRVRNGYVPTATQDDLFTRLSDAWAEAVEGNAASTAGTYSGKHATPRALTAA